MRARETQNYLFFFLLENCQEPRQGNTYIHTNASTLHRVYYLAKTVAQAIKDNNQLNLLYKKCNTILYDSIRPSQCQKKQCLWYNKALFKLRSVFLSVFIFFFFFPGQCLSLGATKQDLAFSCNQLKRERESLFFLYQFTQGQLLCPTIYKKIKSCTIQVTLEIKGSDLAWQFNKIGLSVADQAMRLTGLN